MGCAFNGEQLQDTVNNQGRHTKLQTIDNRKKSTQVVDTIIENVTLRPQNLSAQEIGFAVQILKKHQLFQSLKQEEITAICENLVYVFGTANSYLFKQGDLGNSFFLIHNGGVTVEVNGHQVKQLNQGNCFGELALLLRAARSASIKCNNIQCSFMVMKPGIYRRILQEMKMKEYEKSKNIVDRIQIFHSLSNKQKNLLSNTVKNIKYAKGQTIFQHADVANSFFIIESGQVRIDIPGKEQIVLSNLQSFGETALRAGSLRTGTAVAITNTQVAVMSRMDIQKVIGPSINSLIFFNQKKWCLLRSKHFHQLNKTIINSLIMAIDVKSVPDDHVILQGKPEGVYAVLQGKINKSAEGNMLCDEQWRQKIPKPCLLVKNQPGFYGYLSYSQINTIIQEVQRKQSAMRQSQRKIAEKQNIVPMNLNNFAHLKKLGEGQFGQVHLVRSSATMGSVYALKCLNKKSIKQQGMEQCVSLQKKILQQISYPLIVGYVQAYQDASNIYLLMEFINGKEMFDVIRQISILNKNIASFYFGSLLLSIEYLHSRNIIYRDIKPENSVVNKEGKVYLIDLGTAKILTKEKCFRTFTIIGTPHYMAPEVFQGKGYSLEADYWSLGIILYEFICARLPFGEDIGGDEDPYKLYSIIKRNKLIYPPFMKDLKVQEVINTLLTKSPTDRAIVANLTKIKAMKYFQGFSWNDLMNGKITPPYIPRDYKKKTQENIEQLKGVPLMNHIYKGSPKTINRNTVKQWDGQFK